MTVEVLPKPGKRQFLLKRVVSDAISRRQPMAQGSVVAEGVDGSDRSFPKWCFPRGFTIGTRLSDPKAPWWDGGLLFHTQQESRNDGPTAQNSYRLDSLGQCLGDAYDGERWPRVSLLM